MLLSGDAEGSPLACYPRPFSSCSWLCPAPPGALQPMGDTPACTLKFYLHIRHPDAIYFPLTHPSMWLTLGKTDVGKRPIKSWK